MDNEETATITFCLPDGSEAVAVEIAPEGKRATRWRYDALDIEMEKPVPVSEAEIVAEFERAAVQLTVDS